MFARIVAPHFVAGIELMDDCVYNAAPIVSYMIGWDRDRVRAYCRLKGWKIDIIKALEV